MKIFSRGLIVLLTLMALASLHGYLGVFEPTARRFIAALCLVGIPFVAFRREHVHSPSISAAAVALALLLHSGQVLFLAPFVIACLARFRQGLLSQMALAWFAFDALELVRLETGWARLWNDATAWTNHGPTPLSLGVFAFAVLVVLVGCRFSRPRLATAALAILFFAGALYFRSIYIPLVAVGLTFYLREEEESPFTLQYVAIPVAAVGIVLMVITPLGNPKPGDIVLYRPGLFNPDKPKPDERMKDVEGPLVACLFDVLSSFGHTVRLQEGGIEPDPKTQVVVLINPKRAMTAREIDRLYEFMERGGSVLTIGEHTNVDGVRDHLNPLTKRAGITLNDDTTWPWDEPYIWGFYLDWIRHPMFRSVKSEDDIQAGVGCSLTLSHPARPLLIGRAGYSDAGDPSNAEQAFLGNKKRDDGERLGDLVLAAESRVGRGKLVVFGDSLTFQDAYVPRTWSYVISLFAYLSRSDTAPGTIWKVLGLAALAFLFRRKWVLTAAASAWAALVVHDIVAPTFPIPEFKPSLPVAWIDLSHRPLTLRPMSDAPDSADGLVYNLYQNGFLPLYLGRMDDPRLLQSKVLILPASARAWTPREISTLDHYLRGNRTVIASVGFPDRYSAAPLLSHFGMELAGKPLGNGKTNIKFHSCWPIRGAIQPLVRAFDYPVVARKGGFILLADSHFFSMKNFEGYTAVNEENVAFFRSLLQEARKP
jgi:hypothetical protein